ncbi:MAG: (d)CMP kinase, partial [Planctomycetota bacterium]
RLKQEQSLPPEPTPSELAHMAKRCRIDFDWATDPPAVLLNDEIVTHLLRSDDTTRASSFIATVPAIREQLVTQQREIGSEHSGKGMVTEGRDQGTVVFPEAEHKFFLTADVEERAKRRVAQLRERGDTVDEKQILNEMVKRDKRDTEREIAPLMPADDAAIINTTKMTQPEVIDHIVAAVRGGGTAYALEQEARV